MDDCLATLVDIGKILFSNTCDNSSFVRNVFVVTIKVCHCYFAVVINCVFTWFNVTFVSTNLFQLANINCIVVVYASFHISNLQITSIDTSFCNGWTTVNSQAIVSDVSVTNFDRPIWSQIDVFIQCKFNSCITIIISLFNGHVFAGLHFHSFAVKDFLNASRTLCHFTFCSSRFHVERAHIASFQTAQVDNCLRAVNSFTITILVSQCNLFVSIYSVFSHIVISACCRSYMQVISFGNTSYVTNVSSVIDCVATRFKVSDVVITKIQVTTSDTDVVTTKVHCRTTIVSDGCNFFKILIQGICICLLAKRCFNILFNC